jgi:hypothetical protein
MAQNWHPRGWILVAALAIGIALLLLLAPYGHGDHASDWAAILPLLFVGVISPLMLLPREDSLYASRTPDAPVMPSRFQRPPPFLLA